MCTVYHIVSLTLQTHWSPFQETTMSISLVSVIYYALYVEANLLLFVITCIVLACITKCCEKYP